MKHMYVIIIYVANCAVTLRKENEANEAQLKDCKRAELWVVCAMTLLIDAL